MSRSFDYLESRWCHFLVSLVVSPTARRSWRKHRAQRSVLCYTPILRVEALDVDAAPCAAQMRSSRPAVLPLSCEFGCESDRAAKPVQAQSAAQRFVLFADTWG